MIPKEIFREIENLKEDNQSGANEFILKALSIINDQLNYIKDQNKDISALVLALSKEIISSRPSMAPLINTIGFLIHDLVTINKSSILSRISKLKKKREEALSKLSLNFNSFLKRIGEASLMLISYSSTILDLLTKYDKNNLILYILESRPLLEGQYVAQILSKKYKTHLLVDAAMGKFIDKVDYVLIGVDSILNDGSVINKVGTFPLAVLAKSTKVEVYAICDSFKYNVMSHYGLEVEIEEKPIEQVYNKEFDNKLLKIHNYYFDKTPPEFIKGIISEFGILSIQEFINQVRNELPIEWYNKLMRSEIV
ncbi:MAG: hypothetical protein ACFFBY_10955 [Promethearchaeota archaeon]